MPSFQSGDNTSAATPHLTRSGGFRFIQLLHTTPHRHSRAPRAWRLGIPVAALSIGVLIVVVQIVLSHAGPILKGRVIETLRARFDTDVQLDNLQVSIARGLEVSGSGLRIFPRSNERTPANKPPLIAIEHFQFRSSAVGLFRSEE